MSEVPTSKNRYEADFLPEEPHTWYELQEAVMNNLDRALELIPDLPVEELTIQNLENIEPGTYRLKSRPDISLLKELPRFSEGQREVGLFCIHGMWIIVLSSGMHVSLPKTLSSVQDQRVFQLDIHTHPGVDPGAEQPSEEDIYKLDSTIDGYNYIINEKGILEFRLPEKMPGGFADLTYVRRAWSDWVVDELKLSENEFEKIGGWELKKQFFEKFFGMRQIPWSSMSEIDTILDKGARP